MARVHPWFPFIVTGGNIMEQFEFELYCHVCGRNHCFKVNADSQEEANTIAEEMMTYDHEGVSVQICEEAEAIFPA